MNEVIGVAGYVLPGTHVDVVGTASASNNSQDITSKVVLSNVEVLAAGTRLEQDSKDSKPMQVTVVTLLVTPEEAEKLTLVSTEGKIQLALRNPLDLESPDTTGARAATTLAARRPDPHKQQDRVEQSPVHRPRRRQRRRRPHQPLKSSVATNV